MKVVKTIIEWLLVAGIIALMNLVCWGVYALWGEKGLVYGLGVMMASLFPVMVYSLK